MGAGNSVRQHSHTERNQKEKFKLILTRQFIRDVDYLHEKVGNVEWSGILKTNIVSGDIDDVSKLVIKTDGIIFMNIGSGAYTEYNFNSDDKYLMNELSDSLLNKKKLGHIHTHHSMNIFFSGTDMDELHDNAPKYNWYLSLIVGFDSPKKWIAKIAQSIEEKYEGEVSKTIQFKGNKGIEIVSKSQKVNSVQKYLNIWDAEVEIETDNINPSEDLVTRYADIAEKCKPKKINYYGQDYDSYWPDNTGYTASVGKQTSIGFGRDRNDMYNKYHTNVRIIEFTRRLLSNDFTEKYEHNNVIFPVIDKITKLKKKAKEELIDDIIYFYETNAVEFFKLHDMDVKEQSLEIDLITRAVIGKLDLFKYQPSINRIIKELKLCLIPDEAEHAESL
jgi:hypothetical protein